MDTDEINRKFNQEILSKEGEESASILEAVNDPDLFTFFVARTMLTSEDALPGFQGSTKHEAAIRQHDEAYETMFATIKGRYRLSDEATLRVFDQVLDTEGRSMKST